MTLLAVHTVPLWQEDDGSLTLGIEPRADYRIPPVVAWCNVARIYLDGELRWFLLALDAAR